MDCWICGKPVTPPRKHYCSDACAREARRRRKRATSPRHRDDSPVYYDRRCSVCGQVVSMHIKSTRCASCQHAADLAALREHKRRKAAGHARTLGDSYPCERCGELYTLLGGLQRYCKRCAAAATRAAKLERTREERQEARADPARRERINASRRTGWQAQQRVCVICGASFAPAHPSTTACSDACKREQQRRRRQKADASRSEQRKAGRKAQRDALRQLPADEQRRIREEINAKAREAYRKRKTKEDTTT